MSNHETKPILNSVHLYLAFCRVSHGNKKALCLREVDQGLGYELESLIKKCETKGGYWRIHRTVNARNVEKARKILIKELIDYPEKASYIDTLWRTALLQKECKETDYFMLDVDTLDENEVLHVKSIIKTNDVLKLIPSPNGWHIVTKSFDTREVCELSYVSLHRDGYYFVKEVK